MREALYRGKRLSDGCWVEGVPYTYQNGEVLLLTYDQRHNFELAGSEVDPATVGQCTGLMDKNGVRVFEGDIVMLQSREGRHLVEDNDRVAVAWHDDCQGFVGTNESLRDDDMYLPLSSRENIEVYSIVVVGNVHDRGEEG